MSTLFELTVRHFKCVKSTPLYLIYFLIFLNEISFLAFLYLRAPYDTLIALAAFLKESNVIGSLSSEEIMNVLLSYIGLKPNLAFNSFNL